MSDQDKVEEVKEVNKEVDDYIFIFTNLIKLKKI